MLIPNGDTVEECHSFEDVYGWAKQNFVNAFTPGLLVHPTLGMFKICIELCLQSILMLDFRGICAGRILNSIDRKGIKRLCLQEAKAQNL